MIHLKGVSIMNITHKILLTARHRIKKIMTWEGYNLRQVTSPAWGALMWSGSNGTGMRQCGAAMTRATGQGRAPTSARHSSCAPNTPLDDMVVTAAKHKYSRIKPRDLGIPLPILTGTSYVPDPHRSAGPLAVTQGFPDVLLLYKELPDRKICRDANDICH